MKLTLQTTTRCISAEIDDVGEVADLAWALWNEESYEYARDVDGEILFFGSYGEASYFDDAPGSPYDAWLVSRYVRYRMVSPVVCGSEYTRVEAADRYRQTAASNERFFEWLNDARYDMERQRYAWPKNAGGR